mmetsp:Transcript_21268/g.30008  ORF Transcript_21268/g.30008 Transcript_21268/m.30008 type:complete len:89 (+) Transcript_21268:5-271(+)
MFAATSPTRACRPFEAYSQLVGSDASMQANSVVGGVFDIALFLYIHLPLSTVLFFRQSGVHHCLQIAKICVTVSIFQTGIFQVHCEQW